MKNKLGILALSALMAGGVYWHEKNFGVVRFLEVPELLVNMRAKEFCSCHFMLKNEEDYCLKTVLKGYPLFSYRLNKDDKSATFSAFVASATAGVKDPKLGCKLQ